MAFEFVDDLTNPDHTSIQLFLEGTWRFIAGLVYEREAPLLWEGKGSLLELAQITCADTVQPSIQELARVARTEEFLESESVRNHGLVGYPMLFKLKVLRDIEKLWNKVRTGVSNISWRRVLRKVIDAVDVILDSLLAAANMVVPGVGGTAKEFKDTIRVLV